MQAHFRPILNGDNFKEDSRLRPEQAGSSFSYGRELIDYGRLPIRNINLNLLPESNVIVGVCDTGASFSHPDLEGVYLEDLSFDATATLLNEKSPSPQDEQGHGTHVAGTIAAKAWNQIGVAGAAPNVKIISGRVFSREGIGFHSWIGSCIRKMADLGVDVLNLSLGGPKSTFVDRALNYAHDKGVLISLAAGNSAITINEGQTAFTKSAIRVAATTANLHGKPVETRDDILELKENYSNQNVNLRLAPFSNYGDEIDIAAPGTFIASTYLNDNYVFLSGTSMAAPHVAALLALMKEIDPNLDRDIALKILQSSSKEVVPFPLVGVEDNRIYSSILFDKALHLTRERKKQREEGIPNHVNNYKLLGHVESVIIDKEAGQLYISGLVIDKDQPEGIEIRVKIANLENDNDIKEFVTLKRFTTRDCHNLKSYTECNFQASIALSTARFGKHAIQVFGRDESASGHTEYQKLEFGYGSSLTEKIIELDSYKKDQPVVGEILNIKRIHRRIILVQGYAYDPDYEGAINLFLWARRFEYPGAFWSFIDRSEFANRNDIFDNLEGRAAESQFEFAFRIDENLFRSSYELQVMATNRDANQVFLEAHPILYNSSRKPILADPFLETTIKNYEGTSVLAGNNVCRIKVYEYDQEYAIEIYPHTFIERIPPITAVISKVDNKHYLFRKNTEYITSNTTACVWHNFPAQLQQNFKANGNSDISLSCPQDGYFANIKNFNPNDLSVESMRVQTPWVKNNGEFATSLCKAL